MSRILWIGDGGVTTGFGTVTHAIGDRLTDLGHDVHCLAANHTGDYFDTKVKLYRANTKVERDHIGKSRVLEILADVMPDVVIILNDPHVMTGVLFKNSWDPERILLRLRPIIAYLAVDGENVPEAWKVLTRFTKAVGMSSFGARQMGINTVIPHGVDSDVFHPVAEGPITLSNGQVVSSKAECKTAFGYDPEGFLALRVDRNSWRKDFGSTWKAMLPVMRRHADVTVHFQCQGNDPSGGPIFPAMWSRDQETMDRFHLPSEESFNTLRGWPRADLVALYNAADVFVTTSMGEGFGLTIAEAMACGVPVVAQDCSAISELVEDAGILVKPGGVVTAPAGHDLRTARVSEFTVALETLYGAPALREELGRKGRERILNHFNWDAAARGFDRLVRDIHEASLKSGTDPQQAVEEAVASV
jgi:D-inositol-3-phosphate glycosyltransferase